jgi:hypothetical protein
MDHKRSLANINEKLDLNDHQLPEAIFTIESCSQKWKNKRKEKYSENLGFH